MKKGKLWFEPYLRHWTHALHNINDLKRALLALSNWLLPCDHHLPGSTIALSMIAKLTKETRKFC